MKAASAKENTILLMTISTRQFCMGSLALTGRIQFNTKIRKSTSKREAEE